MIAGVMFVGTLSNCGSHTDVIWAKITDLVSQSCQRTENVNCHKLITVCLCPVSSDRVPGL